MPWSQARSTTPGPNHRCYDILSAGFGTHACHRQGDGMANHRPTADDHRGAGRQRSSCGPARPIRDDESGPHCDTTLLGACTTYAIRGKANSGTKRLQKDPSFTQLHTQDPSCAGKLKILSIAHPPTLWLLPQFPVAVVAYRYHKSKLCMYRLDIHWAF